VVASSKLNHPLMRNNISRDDLDALIEYLKKDDPKLTQSSNVRYFEEEWSSWLGVKHSVFVNSGSSANLITLAVLRELHEGGEVIVPPLTWVSDVASVMQNGFKPVFADINPRTLCMDTSKILEKINSRTRAVFMTHVQGFNGLSDILLQELANRKIPLIEDVCESHGATFRSRKLGSFGWISNFSFYYAHHMTTIEGGMVCTNDDDAYQMLRMFRSHGMVRESSDSELRARYAEENPNLNPDFIFAFPAYNVRNTEIGGLLGRRQLMKLDRNNQRRRENFELFIARLDGTKFKTDFEVVGNCNYAFPVVLLEPSTERRDRLEKLLTNQNIEYRRGNAGGGNQLRQPYLKDVIKDREWENFPQAEHIHHYGWYIGNYPDLDRETIEKICVLLNSCS